MKTQPEETTKCECGKVHKLSETTIDDDANTICPACVADMKEEKIITYHIDNNDGELISIDLLNGMEHEGCLQKQIEFAESIGDLEPDEDGIIMQFTVTVKKVMTEKEVMELPEKQ